MTVRLNPQIIGQAENAHRALLDRVLSGTGRTREQWIALAITAGSGSSIARDQLVQRIVGALKVEEPVAQATIAELIGAQVLEADEASMLRFTAVGRELHARIRSAIDTTVTPLYNDIAAVDLETAGRVLTEITARANAQLAATGQRP
jgi:hypothetical protein